MLFLSNNRKSSLKYSQLLSLKIINVRRRATRKNSHPDRTQRDVIKPVRSRRALFFVISEKIGETRKDCTRNPTSDLFLGNDLKTDCYLYLAAAARFNSIQSSPTYYCKHVEIYSAASISRNSLAKITESRGGRRYLPGNNSERFVHNAALLSRSYPVCCFFAHSNPFDLPGFIS